MTETALSRDLFGKPWAILPEKLEAIAEMVDRHAQGVRLAPELVEKMVADRPSPRTQGNAIGILPIFGTLHRHGDMLTEASGGSSTARLGHDFDRMVADPKVGSIILQVNSGGGSVYGIQELGDKIYVARGSKRIVAAVDPIAASAAVWLATAAEEVYVTPSGEMGSIGVLCIHKDISQAEESAGIKTTIVRTPARKAKTMPYEPLDSEAIAKTERDIQAYYESFVGAVARNRNVTSSIVENTFGGGEMLNAKDAQAVGLADGVMDFDAVLSMVADGARSRGRGNRNRMRAAALAD